MNGGLLKSASRVALLAAAGMFVGGVAMPSAKAADLGGDCCADLEERVAELEATTARKGNRKVSLTITGQVNRQIVYWDDGVQSKTYYGVDSTQSSSRFSLLGEARIAPKVKAGFEIMLEIEGGGTASKLNQLDEDGKITTAAPLGNNISFNGPNVDAYFGDARRVAWWLEHGDVGRITVGRYEGTGTPYTIDLGGIAAVAPGSKSIGPMVASFFIRAPDGSLSAVRWTDVLDPVGQSGGAGGRAELLRYDSPSLMGFIFSSHIAEAGDYWGVQLRYAGEFSGFRLAAHIGYDKSKDRPTPAAYDPLNAAFTLPRLEVTSFGVAASLMHVPTGLFVQGHWFKTEFDGPGAANGYWGAQTLGTAAVTQPDGKDWLVQGGIAKNWFGWGNTALYGEYGKSLDWGALNSGRDYPGSTACTSPPFTGLCSANLTGVADVTETEATLWGLGVVQHVDAAAMELYLGYRRYSLDLVGAPGTTATGALSATGTLGASTITTTGPAVGISPEDYWTIAAGARIKF